MQVNASPSVLLPQTHSDAEFAPIAVDWDLAFTRAPAKKAMAYWAQLCAGRTMPRRREVLPGPMRSYLRHVNLIDVLRADDGAKSDFIVTLQGQHAVEVVGNVTRRKLNEVLPVPVEQRWRYCFNICLDAARPVRLSSRICAGGKWWLESESLLAPLGDEVHGIDTLFLVFDSWPTPDEGVRGPPLPF